MHLSENSELKADKLFKNCRSSSWNASSSVFANETRWGNLLKRVDRSIYLYWKRTHKLPNHCINPLNIKILFNILYSSGPQPILYQGPVWRENNFSTDCFPLRGKQFLQKTIFPQQWREVEWFCVLSRSHAYADKASFSCAAWFLAWFYRNEQWNFTKGRG